MQDEGFKDIVWDLLHSMPMMPTTQIEEEIDPLDQPSDLEIALIESESWGAADAVNDFTRRKMRESGFFRKIMPPLQISNEDLDRQVITDKPVKIVNGL